jgi:DNA ligase-1
MNCELIGPKFRPMLAASKPKHFTDEQFFEDLRYPVAATPKIDGIRCLVSFQDDRIHGNIAVTRSLKPIPNHHIRRMLSLLPAGLDGELIATGGTFQGCQSAIMAEQGEPDFQYWVFDHVRSHRYPESREPYSERVERLKSLDLPDFCVKLLPTIVQRGELQEYSERMLGEGHEGCIIRTIPSPYKFGRSTYREQWMVKIKQFVDDEAVVVGSEEEMHNANEATRNDLGYLERTSHAGNMVGKGRLGALVVRNAKFGEFRVGSGFSAGDRESLWRDRDSLPGRIVTFRYQPQGVKDRPRIPIFKGFRDGRDLDADSGEARAISPGVGGNLEQGELL